LDDLASLERGQWLGAVHRQDQPDEVGINLQQIYEGGEPFEELIDHPSWISHVTRYVGGDDGLFIDENLVTTRGPGQGVTLHSGGHKRRIRTQFRYHDGRFRCGQINILLALNDCGPGDGATMVIPGSHKTNLPHPQFAEMAVHGKTMESVAGAVEVHMKAGDALLFVDCLSHGSAARTNPGERRIVIYRYGPSSFGPRHGYVPSKELLSTLTPERRRILQPVAPLHSAQD
jgi:hypothetical protein